MRNITAFLQQVDRNGQPQTMMLAECD